MNYLIDPASGHPAYLQLYYQLRSDIVNGFYALGDRLPSKRLLAEETGTSVVTTEHAYALLAEEGYIESRTRSGFYVTYQVGQIMNPSEENAAADLPTVQKAAKHGKDVREAASHGDGSEAFPFSVFARTIRKVLSIYDTRILDRSPYNGIPELRHALASYLGRSRGMNVSPDQILIGSGAEYLYSLIIQLIGRDHIIALEDPSYETIRLVYEAGGMKTEQLTMGNDGIKSSCLADSHASVLHITPFHSYPSGVTASAGKRREYIRWAERRNGFIVEDDYDSEFTLSSKAEDTVFSLEPTHTVFYLNTFSRTLSSSIRIGYMVLPSQLVEELTAKINFYSCTVPVFDQLVLAEFIENGDFERHINRIRRAKRRKETNS